MPFTSSNLCICLFIFLSFNSGHSPYIIYACVIMRAHVRIYKYICIMHKSTKTNKLTDISTLNI